MPFCLNFNDECGEYPRFGNLWEGLLWEVTSSPMYIIDFSYVNIMGGGGISKGIA